MNHSGGWAGDRADERATRTDPLLLMMPTAVTELHCQARGRQRRERKRERRREEEKRKRGAACASITLSSR